MKNYTLKMRNQSAPVENELCKFVDFKAWNSVNYGLRDGKYYPALVLLVNSRELNEDFVLPAPFRPSIGVERS